MSASTSATTFKNSSRNLLSLYCSFTYSIFVIFQTHRIPTSLFHVTPSTVVPLYFCSSRCKTDCLVCGVSFINIVFGIMHKLKFNSFLLTLRLTFFSSTSTCSILVVRMSSSFSTDCVWTHVHEWCHLSTALLRRNILRPHFLSLLRKWKCSQE